MGETPRVCRPPDPHPGSVAPRRGPVRRAASRPPAHVDDAWRLVDYFKSHARRVHAAIACGPGTDKMRAVKAILDWVRAGQRASFSEHEFKQARRWVKDEALAGA